MLLSVKMLWIDECYEYYGCIRCKGAGDTLVLDLGTFPVIKLSVGVR